jgi:TonB-linked SusC/RagA family outer membrane protein
MKKIHKKNSIVFFEGFKFLLLLMKFSFLFIFLTTINVSANVYSQNAKMNFVIEQQSLRDVLKLIESKSSYRFFFSDDFNALDQKVTLQAKNASLENIMARIMQQTTASYKVLENNVVVISPFSMQQVRISGVVTDATTGAPIPGVNVVVEGTSVGTTTENDGHYSIGIPDNNARLVFSFIGYLAEKIEVKSQKIIDVQLSPEITDLNEIVVVGYGTQKKLSVVGSIETLAPKQLEVGSTRSLSNNLAGQVAGVIAVTRSGEPGYDNSNFWIRGISSFSGSTTPLVLVDGIERDLNNIDPAEIESFSVLKDASASAMYGVRGANGVIIINTKRGRVGPPSVNLRVEHAISEPTKLPKFIGGADYMELLNELKENKAQLPYSQEQIDKTRNGYDKDLYPDVNWLDEITKNYAYSTRGNLTVSGGSKFLCYSLVSSVYNEQGIIASDKTLPYSTDLKLTRYNMRANVDLDITSTTTMRLNIGGYMQDRRAPNHNIDDLFSQAFTTSPIVHPARYSEVRVGESVQDTVVTKMQLNVRPPCFFTKLPEMPHTGTMPNIWALLWKHIM